MVVTFLNNVYIAVERARGNPARIFRLNLGVIALKLSLTAVFVYLLNGDLVMIGLASLLSQIFLFAFALKYSFFDDGALTNAVFSSGLHTVAGGGSGVFYKCWALRNISPSKMNLVSTGTDAFRELRLDHGLDFSGATFTSLPERTLYDIHCTGPDGKPRPITLPPTLRSVGKQALYGQAAWNQLFVFLGDKPTFGENAIKPVQPGNAGKRFFIVADVARYPAWAATDFTELSADDKTASDYPAVYLHRVPEYPGTKVIGWLSTGAGGYKNWLIQAKSRGFMFVLR